MGVQQNIFKADAGQYPALNLQKQENHKTEAAVFSGAALCSSGLAAFMHFSNRLGIKMDGAEIKLPAHLDMAALPRLKEELEAALASASVLSVDGSGVERIGTPAVQLLLSAAKAFSSESRSFALKDPSPVLAAAFDDLGLNVGQWSVSQ